MPRGESIEREGIHPGIIFAALVAVLAVGGYLYVTLVGDRAPDAPTELMAAPPRATPPPASTTEEQAAPPPIVLPPLEESDPLIRELVGRVSSHPQLVSWLVGDELARSLVAAVDQVARGKSPRKNLRRLAPKGGFQAIDRDGRLEVDPSSYRRYDLFTEVFTSLDTEGTVALYHQLEPLLEEAYREQGYPEGGFETQLSAAIAQLTAVEVPVRVELAPGLEGGYRFADPELESLPPAQKHLLRLGPENARRVQEKLRLFVRAAGIEIR